MSWQKELENGVRSMDGLVHKLGLSPEEAARREEIAERFPMMITPYYLSLVDTSDPDDPIDVLPPLFSQAHGRADGGRAEPRCG